MTQNEFIETLKELNRVLEDALKSHKKVCAERDYYKSQVLERQKNS